MPSRRFTLSLVVSLLLHGIVIAPPWPARFSLPAEKPRPALLAELRPAPVVAEPLLKNTLDPEALRPAVAPAAALVADAARRAVRARKPSPDPLAAAQRKLSDFLFYPPEARARGLEGEVTLLLRLDGQGNLTDVGIAGSSGHELLDQAALKAARAMGPLPGVAAREMFLPVVFRLQ